ncbi:MAG: choice-of-anchor I family protein [Gammaproteobacteria bacterium]|nr:choice-of-anchor I family protein [Gammaproteobacteria bacterium]
MKKCRLQGRLVAAAFTTLLASGALHAAPTLEFTKLWTYDAGASALDNYVDQGVEDGDLAAEAEIVAYDPGSERFFVVNGREQGVDVLDKDGNKIATLDTSSMPGMLPGGAPNSVAVKNGIVAVAVENGTDKQQPGKVMFFAADAAGTNPAPTAEIEVGALPDMVTFTPDGMTLLVANEAEPSDDYTVDPVGTISVIKLPANIAAISAGDVTTLGFGGFNETDIENDGGRIFGNDDTASVEQDIEPEYITVSPDGKTAFVTLQENNAVAKIDLSGAAPVITEIQGLGYKDHSQPGNEFDASNQDGIDGNLQLWPVLGMYQPDAIDSYQVGGNLYYVTANEGDARDYPGYSEEKRVGSGSYDLDPAIYTDPAIEDNNQLGRLNVTTANGNTDADDEFEQIYSYGGRSFSIWDEDGNQVYDSGSLIEKIIAEQFPDRWVDSRSDDKGPEPESITIVEINDWFYALVGLERTSGFMIFDITDPTSPVFQDYLLEDGDISPEGIVFALLEQHARGGSGYVAVANEVSGTTTLYRVSAVPVPATLALFALGMLGLRVARGR